MFHFPLNLSECAGKILLSIPTNTTWACSFHKNSCIIINSMQKYQQVLYAQHIHVCTTYTYTVYIFATFNLCTDKNPVLKSHYTVLPEGEVPNKTNQQDEKIIMTPWKTVLTIHCGNYMYWYSSACTMSLIYMNLGQGMIPNTVYYMHHYIKCVLFFSLQYV